MVIYTPQYHDEYTLYITNLESSSGMLYTTSMSSGRKMNSEEGMTGCVKELEDPENEFEGKETDCGPGN